MSHVAFNLNGEPFAVPPEATGWKVRRTRPKGPPEVVYGLDGAPLVLPLEADLQDLRREARLPGRYRLDAIDDRQQVIEGAQVAYLYVHEDVPVSEPGTEWKRPSPLESALIEAMRLNTSLAQSVISQFPAMMDSAAGLLRAADGAGLPSRSPAVVQEEEEEEEGEEPCKGQASPDLATLLAQAVPPLLAAWTARGAMSPASPVPVGAAATVPATIEGRASAAKGSASSPGRPPGATSGLPSLDPAAMGHFLAIRQALSPDEQALAQALLAELPPDQVQAWMKRLAPLPVAAAVEQLREVLHGSPPSAPISQEGVPS